MMMDMIFKKKLLLLDSIGFDNLYDFLHNVFASKWVLGLSGALVAFATTLDQFISVNIYTPSRGIYILFAATIFDILLGISIAVRDKTFDAYKLNRAWARLATQIIIIGLLNQSEIVWDLIQAWMVSTLLLAFVMTTIWSSFKNAYTLGWLQKDTYLWLERIISIQNIAESFLKRVIKKEKDKQDGKDA